MTNIVKSNIERMRFGNKIRNLREEEGFLLRELAALANIDTALLSKIERGNRIATRKQVNAFANILKQEALELEHLWVADQVLQLVEKESQPKLILELAIKEIQ